MTTGQAAKAVGVGRATLARWWALGLVEPELVTAGGHARWNVEKLKADLRRMARSDDD
ncbi:MerR family transcriptional regulator [Lentzea chajnantorensis]